MEAADPRRTASTFALFMAVSNLSAVGDAIFSAGVVSTGDFPRPFSWTALVVLLA